MEYIFAHKRLCFAALLETMLHKYGYADFNQIDIADILGITLPSNDPLIGRIKNVTISENPYDWGMNISDIDLRSFFKNEKININFSYTNAKVFEDWSFEEFVIENLHSDNIVCTIDYNTLFNRANKQLFGHAILIKNTDGNDLNIFDPGPEEPGNKIVQYYDLYGATKRMNGGLWVFGINKFSDEIDHSAK